MVGHNFYGTHFFEGKNKLFLSRLGLAEIIIDSSTIWEEKNHKMKILNSFRSSCALFAYQFFGSTGKCLLGYSRKLIPNDCPLPVTLNRSFAACININPHSVELSQFLSIFSPVVLANSLFSRKCIRVRSPMFLFQGEIWANSYPLYELIIS